MTEKSSPAKQNGNGEFRKWLWDPDRKAFMGRTGVNWVQLLVFYTLFYLCLAAFWLIALTLFMQTIDRKYPKWQQDASRIGTSPGLGFRPRPSSTKVETTLIWFTSGSNGNFQSYIDDLESFVKPYAQQSGDGIGAGEAVASVDDCKNPAFVPPTGKFCPFNYKDIFNKPDEQCTAANKFGFDKGSPCILVKINKIYGWVPKPYTTFPSKMPAHNGTSGGVVITCEGENPADKENIGPIRYAPSQTVPANHFPFTNQEGYQAPFVMVQFLQPSRGILINVECKGWAENMRYNRKEGEGSVHFELLVD